MRKNIWNFKLNSYICKVCPKRKSAMRGRNRAEIRLPTENAPITKRDGCFYLQHYLVHLQHNVEHLQHNVEHLPHSLLSCLKKIH